MTRTALVYGIALAGDAVAGQLAARGWKLVVADDKPTPDKQRMASAVGASLVESPDAAMIDQLVTDCDIVCPEIGRAHV